MLLAFAGGCSLGPRTAWRPLEPAVEEISAASRQLLQRL
jgi:hypothetical protein